MDSLIKLLQQKFQQAQQGYQQSPIGALAQGKPQQFMPALKQRVNFFAQHPENISFSGEMQPVNPGGFAGALPLNTRVDQMTSQPMAGPSLARTGFDKVSPVTPSQQNIGQMQVNHQIPDLTMYEQALGKGGQAPNFTILERLSSMHPGDARFMVHKMLLPGLNKIPL